MVRTYQKTPGSRPYRNYTETAMREAIEAVNAGMSKKLAAQTFGVERTTLSRRLAGAHTKAVGRPKVLSDEEEALISRTLGVVANWGFPLTKVDIRDVIKKFLDKQGKTVGVFNNNYPGPDFLDSFIKRNKLSTRMASNIKRSRASVDRDDILQFFDNIDLTIREVKSVNFYNYDETNVTDDPGSRKVVVPRNTKRVERVQEHSRATISLMVCGNANGDLLPPMVVYKALNLYDNWTKGGPQGTKYASSSSGWFDMNLFETWFFELFLPHVESTRENNDKVVLIGDNLASHFSPKVIEACGANNIYITPFPANATHLMQPLDVAVFAPMKRKWREILDQWRKESRFQGTIPKEQFPNLLDRLWRGISPKVSQNLKSGFRATGLHPANPDEVLKRIPDGVQDAEVERILDSSLIDLLKEHRGTGAEKRRKRGKKVEPGTDASRIVTSDSTMASEDPSIVTNDSPAAADKPEPSTSSVVKGAQQISIRKSKRVRKYNSSQCAICRINWKDYRGTSDWIQCTKCRAWICGPCNKDSKDPFYVCERCDDSEDEQSPFDDSDADKDFQLDD